MKPRKGWKKHMKAKKIKRKVGLEEQKKDFLKDGNYHFMFGSLFRRSDGGWYVPFVGGGASGFGRVGRWLGGGWNGNYRVVFLET